MSATHISPDPVAAKAAELKVQFGGRELLTTTEMLSLLGISRMTAYYLAKAGRYIPESRIGRSVRYSVNDTAQFMLGLSSKPIQAASPPKPKQPRLDDAPKLGRPRKTRKAT